MLLSDEDAALVQRLAAALRESRGVHVGEPSAEPTEAMIEAALEACPVLWNVHQVSGTEVDLATIPVNAARESVAKMLRAALRASVPPSENKSEQMRLLTDVVIAMEDAKVVRLYAVPGGQCPYPSDVARALYDRGVRASVPPQEGTNAAAPE